MLLDIYLPVNLHLFDGEGAAADGETGAAAPAEETAKGDKVDLSRVRFGKQEPAPAAQASEPTTAPATPTDATPASEEDVRKEFLGLIRGKYKDAYAAETQKMIDRRYKAAKEAEEKLKAVEPLLRMEGRKYERDATDVAGIVAAALADEANYERRAYANGMTAAQQRHIDEIEDRAAAADALREQAERDQHARETGQRWEAEATALSKEFADFDFADQFENNDRFRDMLCKGIDMKAAYLAANFDKLMQSAVAYSATQSAKNVTDSIRAKGARPVENGASSSNAGIITRSDPSTLSLEEIREIAKRARAGEKIRF